MYRLTMVGTKHGLLECSSVRRKPPGEQWSRRETIEARGTKWNFDVEMDSGVSGPPLESRRDEGMPTATAPMEIPTVPPPSKRSKRKLIRVGSEETQDYVREAKDMDQEEAEEVSFVPSAICETRDLGIRWPHWHTLVLSDETKKLT